MCANDRPTTEFVPIVENMDHQALLERAKALSVPISAQNAASRTASDHPNKLVLKALTDGAKVRIRVSGEISQVRFAGNPDTIRESTVAISRIDEKGERDSFRFSGNIVEFEILEGNVEVTLNDEKVDPVTLDLPNEIVLKALTDDAKVRVKVNGVISEDRVAGDVEMICDGHVLISRIDANDEPDTFRFSGDVVECKVMRGDVKVTLTVADRNP